MPKKSTFLSKLWSFLRTKKGIIVSAIIVLGLLIAIFHHKAPASQLITVQKGSITQSVSITGNTAAAQNVSLSFGSSGIISNTYTDLGKQVYAGQVLAELNTSDLTAQLLQAQANVATQQARLEGLQNGSSPEQIALAQVNLDNAKADLANTTTQQQTAVDNAYRSLLNSTIIAYPTSTGSNASTVVPTISGTYTGTDKGTITITTYGAGTGGYFVASGLVSASGQISANPVALGTSGLYISFPALIPTGQSWVASIPNIQASNYLTNLNLYNSALTTQSTTIAQKQALVAQLQAQLDIEKAGSTAADISAQEAQVAQAQASVESAKAKLVNAEIVAPISGTITQFDAKVGQLASPSVPLVSIISDSGYEVDSGVSETDVGKITVGNVVTMTLDAFPNETFTGKVFYIAPAETNIQGVVNYEVKISFDKPDTRLKSGLTANIVINTQTKDRVLILPEYAILQNDSGTFVEVQDGKTVKQIPVVLGIQSQKGDVEVISGVTEGEQVINVGLKS